MAKILNIDKIIIECDCGNVFPLENISGAACDKCGNYYEIMLNLCPEHRFSS